VQDSLEEKLGAM